MHFWIALHHPYHFFGEANSSSSSDPDARVVCHLLLTVINFRTRQEAAQLSQISYNARRKAAKITQIDRPRKKSYEEANIICKKAVDNHVKKMKVICKLHPFFPLLSSSFEFENAFSDSDRPNCSVRFGVRPNLVVRWVRGFGRTKGFGQPN